jgi:dihydrofolate reductase
MINLIWAEAFDKNGKAGVIGFEGKIPWFVPEDLAYFKKVTFGMPVIMGRKTYDSLPKKPLPGRKNIVITRNMELLKGSNSADNPSFVDSIEGALEVAGEVGHCAGEVGIVREAECVSDTGRAGDVGRSSEVGRMDEAAKIDAVWIIGGEGVYKESLPFADKVFITKVNLRVDADTYAPQLPKEWMLLESSGKKVSADGIEFVHEVWGKVRG